MYKFALSFIVSLFAVGSLSAQDATQPSSDANASPKRLESYVVQLTEYRMKVPFDASKTAPEIIALLLNPTGNQKNEPVETIRLSVLSGFESMVQFGKTVRVSTGTVTSSRGTTTRQMQSVQIGSMVRVTATTQNEKVALELNFTSSRHEDGAEEDSPPNVATTTISTTQLLELNKPSLIGGSTSGADSYVLLSVTR